MAVPDDNTGRRRPGKIVSRLLFALAVLLIAHLSLCAGIYWAMCQPPDLFGRIMARVPFPMMMVLPFETLWKHARAGAINPGDSAPDFQLPTLDHKDTVRLSAFRGSRPVILVFGSYT
jgi:hypothetical protein